MPRDDRGDWIGLVVVVTIVQAAMSLMTRALPLLGLPLTRAAGMPSEAVGQLAAATSLGSMAYFLWGPAVLAGFGALRQLQIGCIVAALALLLCVADDWAAMLLAAFVIGVGYGPSTPAGSELLMRNVPAERRATIFSIKQAGVPMGGLVAGLLLPPIALWSGHAGVALLAAAGVVLVVAIGLGQWRGEIDMPGGATMPATDWRWRSLLGAPIEMFRLVFASRALRLVTGAGFALGIAQGVLLGYYPVYLSTHVGWSLTSAGFAFAVLQGAGIGGRILMGWVSDLCGDATRAMIWLCFVSGATMVLIAGFGPETPAWWIAAVSFLAGVTVVSWNGVFLTGLAAAAPPGRIGEITSAGSFVLFTGFVASPIAIQWVFALTDGYAGGLVVAGLAPIVAGVTLSLGRRTPPAA